MFLVEEKKIDKNDFEKSLHFEGGGQDQFGKSLHFEFFFMTASLMCLCAHLFGNVSFLLSDPWPTGDRCGDYHIGAYVVITTLMLK